MNFEEYKIKVGKRIKQIRKEKKLTQMDLDIEPNEIPVRTLQDIENGRTNVTLKNLFYISKKLGVKPEDLIDVEAQK